MWGLAGYFGRSRNALSIQFGQADMLTNCEAGLDLVEMHFNLVMSADGT